ncbi:amino acid adenylation domain-containing protein, partial [Streptomyces sp. NPDC090798]|uniref:amino acid adenylation domain-containing protein n=1 Tax=Streptomyces sp. NPDC090798 TaxID=3365968 RepID=UPI00381BE604
AGELYIAGAQLARGYLGRAGLTAERFVADPFAVAPGARMYRTGDVVRWSADGVLEFVGRADAQVKVRGFRIEPGEVEAVLAGHGQVARAAVVVREDQPGDKRLVAYLVAEANDGVVDTSVLRQHVSERLPDYMVPSAFVTLDSLPLTPNGKLDRRALPAPEYTSKASGRAPRSPREEILCGLFAEVLGVDSVSIDDSFFELGGHSLLATRLVSRVRSVLGVEVGIRSLFEAPSVAGLVGRLDEGGRVRERLGVRVRPEVLPVSYAQRRLWFLGQLEGASATYNIPLALRLSGALDVEALRAALADVAGRHESLRTVFRQSADGQPSQLIVDPGAGAPEVRVESVSSGEVASAVAGIAGTGFDLERDLPWRVRLLEVADAADEWVLVMVVHHIAADGWSMAPLAKDLSEAYAARREGRGPAWQLLPVQYADFTLWQREVLGDEDDPESVIAGQVAFWREALADLPEQLELPVDFPRPAVASHEGASVDVRVPGEVHARLVELSRSCGASVFMTVQAALAVLLSKMGAGEDIPIGTPVAGRTDDALDDLVGFFVNTLVLRTDVAGDPTFRQVVERVREADLAAFAHQDVPFERLVEVLNPARSMARHPLFQVMLAFHNNVRPDLDLPGIQAHPQPVHIPAARFDLSFNLAETLGRDGSPVGLQGTLDYRTDLFDRTTVEQLAERLSRLLEAVAGNPDRPIRTLGVLGTEERRRLLVDWNDTAREIPEATLPELFQAQVTRTPDALAVVSGDIELTYAELGTRVRQLANGLVSRGIGPGDRVALLLDGWTDQIAMTLAVTHAGAAYVPLDSRSPAARLELILGDSRSIAVVVDRKTLALIPGNRRGQGIDVVLVEDLPSRGVSAAAGPAPVVRPLDLAYVMFTSGSTGRPKGVAVTHRNVVALVSDQYWGRTAEDRVLVHSSPSFDASTYEVWGGLLKGATVVTSGGVAADIPELARTMAGAHVTVGLFNEGIFRLLAESEPQSFGTLRDVYVGGDTVSLSAVRKVMDHTSGMRFTNSYGPTESTLCVAHHSLLPGADDRASIPIGRPLDNTRLYVLDEALEPVPWGVIGELYIAGEGLARGYVDRPDLTAERFVADPFGSVGTRMYRTGDRVKWRPDGTLEFAGRTDTQVKIRGFRIEPGEIETVLESFTGVAQAVVVVREDRPGDKRLVAYLVADADVRIEPDDLRLRLAEALPDYMIPAALVQLDALPLGPTGKLERAALPAPDYAGGGGRAPRTERERILCAVFADVLGVGEVCADDNFFAMGGDSIVSIQLVAKARAAGLTVTPQQVFERKTVEALAAVAIEVDTRNAEAADPGTGAVPLTPVMHQLRERGGAIERFSQSVTLVTPGGLLRDDLTAAVQAIVDLHDLLRARLTTADADGTWQLEVLPPGSVSAVSCLTRVEAAGLGERELRALAVQQEDEARSLLSPAEGRMLHAVWLDAGPHEHGRLVITLHHLAVDAVSWRILVPDLVSAWQDIAADRQPNLQPVYTTFRRWADHTCAEAERRVGELPFWEEVVAETEAPWSSVPALEPAHDTWGTARTITVTLPTELAAPLLTSLPEAYNCGADSVLLAALLTAVGSRTARHDGSTPPFLVDVERHGREQITPALDVSRTVGWFTSVSPVRLDMREVGGGRAAEDVLKYVKEQLRAAPDNGFGYGLLRYLHPETAARLAALPEPHILFNYLGRVPAPTGQGGTAQPWSVVDDGEAGGGADTDMPMAHALTINAVARDTGAGPELLTTWAWPGRLWAAADVQGLAEAYTQALTLMATSAESPGIGGLTPSDVPLLGLSQDEIDEFEFEFAETED